MEHIIVAKENEVGTITLYDPDQLNGIGGSMVPEFVDAFRAFEADDDVRVIVINGYGKGFCGGAAMASLEETGSGGAGIDMEMVSEWPRLIRNSWKPVIASVHGACAGAGMSLALLSDFCVAAEHSAFVLPFINVSLTADLGGAYALTRHVNFKKAMQLMMLADRITADEAFDLGIVTKVVADDELAEETAKLAAKLAGKPKEALRIMKQFANLSCWDDLENELRMELLANDLLSKCANFREGVAAFMEKRKPEFNKR